MSLQHNNLPLCSVSEVPAVELPPPGTPDIEIARAVQPQSIGLLAQQRFGLTPDCLVPYGHYKAKLNLNALNLGDPAKQGRLVLVTAMTPTAAGEGKTTTSVGLNDALNLLGVKSSVCLREPSLGPCFGMKGGAAGGGRAQIIPMEDLNLHFNGDFHAITSSHNLLSALVDNHIHWGNECGLDPRRISWRRVLDLNDRALRQVVVGLGGPAQGVPRESGFDITVASEVMAVLCLADSLEDLRLRLSRIIVGRRQEGTPVTVADIGAQGAMTVLLREALQPNLVQSLEHNPAFVHGGPFANIAHGCNSALATRAALALNDVVVTEAGFGADLGAEKFLNIKCRQTGMKPDAVVLVCTLRALKLQGGATRGNLDEPNSEILQLGMANLERHIHNLALFGLTPVVCINEFPNDTEGELAQVRMLCESQGASAVRARHWAEGGEGALELAQAVQDKLAAEPPDVRFLYQDEMPLVEKIYHLATELYGAAGLDLSPLAQRQLEEYEALGYGQLPVCIAKTQYSFSADPKLLGAPSGHRLPVREARLAAGAGFIVVICGDIMTMPGLPRHPAALDMRVDAQGLVQGLA